MGSLRSSGASGAASDVGPLGDALASALEKAGATGGACVKLARLSSRPPHVAEPVDRPTLVVAAGAAPSEGWDAVFARLPTFDPTASHCQAFRAEGRAFFASPALSSHGEVVGAVVLAAEDAPRPGELALLCAWLGRELELTAHAALVERQRDRLQLALEAADVGVWSWDFDTEVVKWSPEVERMWGLPRGTFDGTAVSYWASIHRDDAERLQQVVTTFIEQARDGRQSPGGFHVQHRIVRPSGEVRWADCRGYTMTSQGVVVGMTGTVVDITEQKRHEEQARLDEQRSRLFSELASDYVYEIDLAQSTMAPTMVAGSFERIVKLSLEEVAQRGGWLAIIHPDDRESIANSLPKLLAGQPIMSEYRIIDGEGTVRWMRDSVRPVRNAEGKVSHLIGGATDITDAKQLQERLDHALKLEALARLAGGVAHDFNNLLMLTYTGLDLLREETHAMTKDGLQALEDIAYSAQRSGEIARSLLAFGRRQLDNPQQFDVAAMLRSMASMLRKTTGPQVRVRIITDGEALPVRMDPGQLQLVILNLVLNARDAMPEGGELTVQAGERELSRTDADRPAELSPGLYVAISVTDTGTGIAPDAMSRLFEPFFTTKAAAGGTGMGLATSHGTVRQAGGAIVARSAIGRGSTFKVILPRALESFDEDRPASFTRVAVGGQENIVLVEDDSHVRRVLGRSLEGWGYSVMSYGSGEEALASMFQREEPCDLLLTDYNLPGMNGTALTRRCLERWPRLRAIVMTGFLAEDVLRSGPAQVTVVAKPFTQDTLASKIRELLDEAATSGGHSLG